MQLLQGSQIQAPPMQNNTKKDSWTPPLKNTIKLNFDGASKGNPRNAGFGGIFRNHEGSPLLGYFGNIAWDSNNLAELEGLWKEILLSKKYNLHPLEIEGDSQILINMARQIQNWTHVRKITNI